jgi:hypothetical protein
MVSDVLSLKVLPERNLIKTVASLALSLLKNNDFYLLTNSWAIHY